MKQSQKERQACQPQPAQTAKAAPAPVPPPAGPQVPHPDFVTSEGTEAHPVFCAPITPDTRQQSAPLIFDNRPPRHNGYATTVSLQPRNTTTIYQPPTTSHGEKSEPGHPRPATPFESNHMGFDRSEEHNHQPPATNHGERSSPSRLRAK